MAEPRLAKHIAIALGGIEFLFGLFFAVLLFIQFLWMEADPNRSDPWMWPFYCILVLIATGGPIALALIAERSANARKVYICLAILLAYLAIFIAVANINAT